jgi:hypothetical protein
MTEPTSQIIKLSNIPESTLVADMNYQFHYRRVQKADGTLSNYFVLCYKEENQQNWGICKNLLSQEYTVAKTQEVINSIKTSLQANIVNERHFRSTTSVKSSFTLSNIQLSLPEDNISDVVLFKLLTSIEVSTEHLTTSELTFNIINGFSGNHALQLNYGIQKKFSYMGNVLQCNNIFILDEFTKRLIHDNHLTLITFEELSNVQAHISDKVKLFKDTTPDQEFINRLNDNFPKKFAKKFTTYYELLIPEQKNMYYLSFILSTILEAERQVSLEIKLRTFINEYLTRNRE